MSRFNLFFLVILMLTFFSLAIVSQADETATEEATPEVVATEEGGVNDVPTDEIVVLSDDVSADLQSKFAAFMTAIITAVWTLAYSPIAAPLVELLTSVSKRLPYLKRFSAPTLTFSFTVLAWIFFIVLNIVGYGERYDDAIKALTMAASVIFGLPITQTMAQGIHSFAQKRSIPILGYSRTPGIGKAFGDVVQNAINDYIDKLARFGIDSSPGEKKLTPIAEAAGAGEVPYEHRG